MALNKPIITTNYSAHTEYCTADNAYLINIDGLTPAEDGKFFDGSGIGQIWDKNKWNNCRIHERCNEGIKPILLV